LDLRNIADLGPFALSLRYLSTNGVLRQFYAYPIHPITNN